MNLWKITLIALLVPPNAAETTDVSTSAEQLVSAYNNRDLGQPGWRRVEIKFEQGDQGRREFRVVNLWSELDGELRTLFLVESPYGLRGTSYMMRERVATTDLQVQLYIPAGERVVHELAPRVLCEGLLGSDFTYQDLRWTLPTQGVRYVLIGSSMLLGHRVRILDMFPDGRDMSYERVRWYLADELQVILAADYFADGADRESTPQRRLRVHHVEKTDAIWQPTLMTMENDQRRTVIRLLECQLRVDSAHAVNEATMRKAADQLRATGSYELRQSNRDEHDGSPLSLLFEESGEVGSCFVPQRVVELLIDLEAICQEELVPWHEGFERNDCLQMFART